MLRVFQQRGVGKHGVYSQFIQNNQNDNQLIKSDEIITKNNIKYYQG
jgi:hypothetical protein